MATIFDVAGYFLSKANLTVGDNITNLKLQKLCYYAQAWYLALEGKRLFDARFEAWAHGPANPGLFEKYRRYGHKPIEHPCVFDSDSLTAEEKEFLDEIWDVYGKYSDEYLERLTQQERPWREARGNLPDGEYCNTPIREETIAEYYRSLVEGNIAGN